MEVCKPETYLMQQNDTKREKIANENVLNEIYNYRALRFQLNNLSRGEITRSGGKFSARKDHWENCTENQKELRKLSQSRSQ